jgi:IMP cyclohydrolase
MGAQSDFIAERFMPGEEYKAQQKAMADSLVAMGLEPEELTTRFLVPVVQLPDPKPESN